MEPNPPLDQDVIKRLQEISIKLLGELDLRELLKMILSGVVELLGAHYGHIYQYVHETDRLSSWVPMRTPNGVVDVELGRGEGTAGKVLETGRPMNIADYDSWEGRSTSIGQGLAGPVIQVPLHHGDAFLGVLSAVRQPGSKPFSNHDLQLLELFGNEASVAISNATLYDEVARAAREMTFLYETSLDLGQHLTFSDLLGTILLGAKKLVGVSDTQLLLLSPSGDSLMPSSPAMEAEGLAPAEPSVGAIAAAQALSKREAVLIDDDQCAKDRPPRQPQGSHSRVMAVPLQSSGDVLGVLVATREKPHKPFTQAEARLLSLFANQAALALRNSQQYDDIMRLYIQVKEKERLDQELKVAYAIQSSLLPESCPQVRDWDFAACWRPAREVGGDFYDFIPIDPGRWGVVIGDVTDKGVPAALFMSLCKGLVRAYALAGRSPCEVLTLVNQQVLSQTRSGMFVTGLYGILETQKSTFTFSNGGHNLPLLRHSDNGKVESIRIPGMAMGIMEDSSYQDHLIRISDGDIVLLYTDGVTDATDSTGQSFGLDRLSRLLSGARVASSEELLHYLQEQIEAFVAGAKQFDDLTLVALRRLSGTEVTPKPSHMRPVDG
jgi:serine phosphatase RsbU (regulator of sigma subunit)